MLLHCYCIAINVTGLFFLCKVIGFVMLVLILLIITTILFAEDTQFIKSYYLEKVSDKKGFIKYRQLDRELFVLLLQILCPTVPHKKDFTLPSNEYQFIGDI